MNLWHRKASAGGLALCVWLAALPATGQDVGAAGRRLDPAQPAGPPDASPITCWWRSDRNAVYVGEQFTLTLTCAVQETAEVRVVADADRLDPAALDLAPFEVVSGTRHGDIEVPPWRYVQYSYRLRLLGDQFFGQDVDIPSMPITYRVESAGVNASRGRGQLYLLPSLPVRVLSLVPRSATDIQDWSLETFGDLERRRSRALGELAAAVVLLALAVLAAGVAAVRIVRPRLAPVAATPHAVAAGPVLRNCLREAARVKDETGRSGWTDELISRSLTVFRIGGALAIGQPLAQQRINGSAPPQDGQLAVRTARRRGAQILVSGAVTSATLAERLGGANGAIDPDAQITLQELGESLQVFTSARYGSNSAVRADALDAALDAGTRALHRLYEATRWRARTARLLSRTAARLRERLWSR